MRCLQKETKPLKDLVQDAVMVFISVVVGEFTYRQMHPLSKMILADGSPQAFTDSPAF